MLVMSCTIDLFDMLLLRKCICKLNSTSSIFVMQNKMSTDSGVVVFQTWDDETATHTLKGQMIYSVEQRCA